MASSADDSGIANTLTAAFFDDPVWSWMFPDPERRSDQIEAVFRLYVGSGLEHRWIWATPRYEAATLWVPPGCPELNEADAARFEPLLEDLVGERAALIREGFDRFEAAHPHDRDHFYLMLLGTHPDHRGAGTGMGLLAANLTEVDRQRMPAYLESTNPANLKRYESVGFEAYSRLEMPDDGPAITTMWREPH